MTHLRPKAKIILGSVITFFVTYAVVHFLTLELNKRERFIHRAEAKIIQNEINERFNLFLDIALVIGQVSSGYIQEQSNVNQSFYGKLIQIILKEKKYILGVNQLDKEGKIINIFPTEANQVAKNKVTQNFKELLMSHQRGEKYWFSPPFKLYQDGFGFVFYIPIADDHSLKGWIAPVISSKEFFQHFKSITFFKDYNLVIKDKITGSEYFATGIKSEDEDVVEIRKEIRGRTIIFQSWPKITMTRMALSPFWHLLISLVVSLIMAYVLKLHFQKKKAFSRLDNISDLLKLTSKEALTKLMDIQAEYLKIGSTGFLSTSIVEKDVQSVTNLIEQIELLQNIASSEQLEEESFEVLPIIEEHLVELQDIIEKKDLKLKIQKESFEKIKITGNKWLISNTVLQNSLSYCVLVSKPSGKIEISHTQTANECCTTYHICDVHEEDVYRTFKIERRLLVARNVMSLLNGDIKIDHEGSKGMTLKLILRL